MNAPVKDRKLSIKEADFRAEPIPETDKTSSIGTSDAVEKEVAEESRGSYGDYELPLGYIDGNGTLFDRVALKEMTGEEEDVFASKKLNVIRKINKVISNCMVSLTNKDGSASIKAEAIEDIVARMTSVDRMFLLVRIRQQSYGDLFKFEFVCDNQVEDENGSHPCGYKQAVTVNLKELDIKIPVDKKKRFFECKLSSGKVVEFKVMTGMEDAQLATGGDDKTLSEVMAMRITKFDGRPANIGDLKKMSLKDRKKLRDEMSKADNAGMDTEIEIECVKCKAVKKDTLRFDSADFFYPEGQ